MVLVVCRLAVLIRRSGRWCRLSLDIAPLLVLTPFRMLVRRGVVMRLRLITRRLLSVRTLSVRVTSS